MLNLLPIPANDIIMYMNIAFIGFIVLGALIGFCRGTMKSTYFLIMTLIIFVGGWFLMGPISKALMNIDLSSFNLTVNGVAVETPLQAVSEILLQQFPEWEIGDLLAPGSYTYSLVTGIVDMVFKIVYVILLIVLSFTLFWLINGLIWLLVRIPFRKIFCKPIIKKNGKKKYRANFFSRLGGAGIGAVKGLMYTLLLGFILAGLASISDSVKEIANATDGETVVVVNDNTFTVVELTDNKEETNPDSNTDKPTDETNKDEGTPNEDPTNPNAGSNPLDDIVNEYGDVLDVLSGYRKTVAGKVFGAIKIGKGDDKATFDEYVFDKIFSIDGKDANVKLRNELRILAKAFSNPAVTELMNGNFDIAKLTTLNKTQLKDLIDTLSSLKTLKVVFPVGLEIITYSNILEQALGDQYQSIKDILTANIEDLLKLDACQQAKSLGYVFVDVLDLLEGKLDDPNNIDFLNFDQKTLDNIFNTLGEMDLVKIVAPIAINYLVSTDAVRQAVEQAGFTIEDLGLDDLTGDDYVKELMNLPKIYEKVVALGIKQVDGQIDLSGIDPTKVAGLTEQLFTSVILSNAIDVVAYSFLTNPDYLPEQFQGIFSEEELKNTNWKEEFTPLLTAAASLLKSGIIDAEDPVKALTDMSDEDFADLGKYLSQSNLITNNLNELLDVVMAELPLEGIKFEGLDKTKGEEWNETEIVSLFKSVKVILDSGIITAEDPMIALKDLTDETIDSLAHNLSQSKYITKNLNSIIDVLMTNVNIDGFEIVGLDPSQGENWDEKELSSLFGAFKTILSTDLITGTDPLQAFKNMTDESIDDLATDLSSSKFFTKNLDGIITFAISQLDSNLTLESLDKTKGETWDKTEIKSVFSSVKTIVNTGILDEGGDPLNKVKDLSDKTIEELSNSLSSSKFMTKNISNLLGMFTGDLGFELAELSQEQWTASEIYSVFKSVTIVAGAADANGNINVEQILGLSDSELGVLLESELLSQSLKNIIVEKSKPGQDLEILKGVYEDGVNENGEKVYDWVDTKVLATCSVKNGILTITPVTNALQYVIYKNNCYFTSTKTDLVIDLNKVNTDYTYVNTDKFTVKAITVNGELRRAFNAISALELKDLSGGVDIDLRNVSKNKDTLLESYILTETLIDQIRQLDNDTPNGILEINTSFKAGGDGEWHGENGELRAIIDALDVALGLSTSKVPVSINGLDMNSISIKKIIASKDTILLSTIVTETVIVKLQELDGQVFDLAKEYKSEDLSVWKDTKTTEGELSILFNVIDKVIPLPETGFDINAENIDLGKIVREREEVLKSAVITTTVVDKIAGLTDLISVPTEYQVPAEASWEKDYKLWKNTYVNGAVSKAGELDHLLNSLGIVLDIEHNDVNINNITEDSISLQTIVDNDTTVFTSEILTATVVKKVQDLNGTITIPVEYAGDYKVWNQTNTNELIYLLDALSYVVPLPEKGFNITTDNINLNNIYNNKNEILKSAILTSTIVEKVTALDTVLNIPTEYKVSATPKWETDYALWKNTYDNGTVKTTGELDDLLNALNYALDLANTQVAIDSISVDSIKLKNIIDNDEKVFNSEILTATVVKKVQELDGTVKIPVEYSGDYKYWGKDQSNELIYLLDALSYVVTLPDTGFNINTDAIELNNIILRKDDILKSAVLTSTIVDKITALDTVLTIPNDYKVSAQPKWETDYDLWKNTYKEGIVETNGELDKLLNSLNIALDLDNNKVTIDKVDANSISLKTIIDNNTKVFKSEILTATVVTKVQELDGTVIIPEEFSTDYKVWNENNTNELNNLLDALSYVVPLPEKGFNINTDQISLNSVYTNRDEILKSAVLTSTIVDKVTALNAVLTIPTEYNVPLTHKWATDYDLWKNTYTNGVVETNGELDNLLNSLNYALDLDNNQININNVSTDTISLKNIISNNTKVFKSEILTATVVSEIQGLSGTIILPEEYTKDYKYWNTSNTNEIIYLLDAIDLSLNIPAKGFNIDPSTIDMAKLLNNKDQILRSAVLTATIVDKISNLGEGITIPTDYKVPATKVWETDYSLWKNTYKENNVLTYGELSYMLGSIDGILGITSSTEPVLIDSIGSKLVNIYLEDVIAKKDVILHSNIININIVDKVKALGTNGIHVPNGYEKYDPWLNTYDTNELVVKEGETSKLLTSLQLTLGLTASGKTPIDGLDINTFKLGNVTSADNRDKVLYSAVLSETLKQQFIDFSNSGTISLPKDYNLNTSKNYFVWENSYNDKGEVLEKGELSNLLGAVDLIAGKTSSMTDFSNLNFAAIFDTTDSVKGFVPQDEILKSKVISETIIQKVAPSMGAGLSVPTDLTLNLNNESDRSNWYNDYSGSITEHKELADLINALGKLIADDQKSDLGNIDLNSTLDSIVNGFGNAEYKKTVLNSYVVSETLRINITGVAVFKDGSIDKAFEINYGNANEADNINNWYGKDNKGNVKELELWNLLTSAAIVLNGASIKGTSEFTIDQIISNKSMIPTYDSNYDVTESNIEVMLRSIIIEQIFAGLAENLIADKLKDVIVAPKDGYNWHKVDAVKNGTEHDLRTFLESYYIVSKYLNPTDIMSSATGLVLLTPTELSDLAAGMVISRTFRGSMANMFNVILGAHYALVYQGNYSQLAKWPSLALQQSKFDAPNTKVQAHDNFVNDYTIICNEIKKAK